VPRLTGVCVAKIPDHRHPRLLSARRERPRRRAAEQRDELAALQLIELHSVPAAKLDGQHIELVEISQRVQRTDALPLAPWPPFGGAFSSLRSVSPLWGKLSALPL